MYKVILTKKEYLAIQILFKDNSRLLEVLEIGCKKTKDDTYKFNLTDDLLDMVLDIIKMQGEKLSLDIFSYIMSLQKKLQAIERG